MNQVAKHDERRGGGSQFKVKPKVITVYRTGSTLGREGAAGCTIREQPRQACFSRTWRMTLKNPGTNSNTSATSSPSLRSVPPQLAQPHPWTTSDD